MILSLSLVGVAAYFDTLLFTGFFFYGTGVSAATVLAVTTGSSLTFILLTIIVTAFLGDCTNYCIGKLLHKHPRVQKVLAKAEGNKTFARFTYRADDSLPRKVVLATIFRFVAATRPFNATLLGVTSRRLLSDLTALAIAACIWSATWFTVVIGLIDVLST